MLISSWKFTTTCNVKYTHCSPILHDENYGVSTYPSVVKFLKKVKCSRLLIFGIKELK
jgi:hypothetical protein